MDLNKTKNEQNRQTTDRSQYAMGEPEAQIRQLIYDFKQAMMAGSIDRIMEFYAPDVVAFDLVPPVQFVGREAYRKSWEKSFAEFGPPTEESGFDIHNLQVTADENIAFSHCLNHCYGKMKDGSNMNMWMRSTNCYKKINGKWLITHEQFSVPIDFESGKALMDLRPEQNQLH